MAVTTPKDKARTGRGCYAADSLFIVAQPADMRGRDHLPQARATSTIELAGAPDASHPRSTDCPKLALDRHAKLLANRRIWSGWRVEALTAGACVGVPRRALAGFRGLRRLPGSFFSDRPLARVQEAHSRDLSWPCRGGRGLYGGHQPLCATKQTLACCPRGGIRAARRIAVAK